MIQKRNNVLELEKKPQESIIPFPAEEVAVQTTAPLLATAKEPAATTRACSFSAVKLGGSVKRKIVLTTISKVLLNSAKEIMPDFSTKQIIESALLNSLKLSNLNLYGSAKKEIESNMGEVL